MYDRDENAEVNSDPDFLVSQNGASGWQVRIISPEALRWTHERAKLLPLDDQTRKFETDLAGVNLLIRQAREVGLTTDYMGPKRLVRF